MVLVRSSNFENFEIYRLLPEHCFLINQKSLKFSEQKICTLTKNDGRIQTSKFVISDFAPNFDI